MPPHPSDLTEYEEGLLEKRQAEYRNKVAADKPTFWEALAKHFLRKRELAETDILVDFLAQKINTWFGNHSPKKSKDDNTFKVGRVFTGERCWGQKNRETIKANLLPIDKKSKGYVAQWNRTRKTLWDDMSAGEQEPWIEMAARWTEEGPDEDVKPEPWRPSFGGNFGMPVFIYGVFQDENKDLNACSYDSSEMFAVEQKSYPQFQVMKRWDVNVRNKFWSFWGATLKPEDADDDITEAVRATQVVTIAPFDFEIYEDGTPGLTDEEDGKPMTTNRKQQVLRQYIRIHYSFACGWKVKSTPWKSMHDNTGKFFADEMLPDAWEWANPVKIYEHDVNEFYKHVINMEKPENEDPDGEPRRFRFSHYEKVIEGQSKWFPAVYPEELEEQQPLRHAKTAVRPPTYVTSPDDDHIHSESPSKLAGSESSTGGTCRALFQPSRTRVRALNITARETARRHAKAAKKKPQVRGKKRKTRTVDDEEWATDEETDEEEERGSMSDRELHHMGTSDEEEDNADHPDDKSNSDGPVPTPIPAQRSALRDSGKGKGRAAATFDEPEVNVPAPTRPNDPLPPCSVGASGPARWEYLRSLSDLVEYQQMLTRFHSKLKEAIPVDTLDGIIWLTWAYASPHLPDTIHASATAADALLNWLRHGLEPTASAQQVQSYVLAMGLTLRDILAAQFIGEDDDIPDHIPSYLLMTALMFSKVEELLQLCKAHSVHRPQPATKATSSGAANPPLGALPENPDAPSKPPVVRKGTRARRPAAKVRPTEPTAIPGGTASQATEDTPEAAPAAPPTRTTRRRGGGAVAAAPHPPPEPSGLGAASGDVDMESEPAATRKRAWSSATQDPNDLVIKTHKQRAAMERENEAAERNRTQASGSRPRKSKPAK